ncbi:alkaline phosphatase D family protein [Hymenobacter defluvii]|uniref:Alkaline phosphatase D family protein n=1 Tax=Hymenobacter defluvii TaxID=2054411 RepID=A0ABS3T9Y0_9BACT|nr:alkaline phosphatase D family protein [Hymenobacter defluvii]MBO3270460.1 alkaline phosphatase D family protein [Hymenobacter defluvii]
MAKKTTSTTITRREFIKHTAVVSGGVALLPTLLSSCNDDNEDLLNYTGDFGFREGVASFDPSQSNVIIWTRYTPADNETGDATIRWEVAEDGGFATVKASGNLTATAANDYTVWTDVPALTAYKKYYYRFRNDQTRAESVVGETRTLPGNGQASSVKLAVVSCANYQAGLFNVYGAVAESDADAVVHLGDYIYEYGAGGYGTNGSTATLNRAHLPATEILSLSDYRTRYRQYRSDKQLQRVHQLKPFIAVWDDHEVTNDAYTDGAENHQANEGSFAQRKQFAQQVWHEYLPARVSDKTKIYRRFDLGGLANLLMLDTRLVGRNQQLNLGSYFSSTGAFNAAAFGSAWLNPTRTMLGTEQRSWLTAALAGSTAKWQVLGSQVLMGKMYIPAELLPLVAQLTSGATPALLTQYATVAAQLLAIKRRIAASDPTVTAAERARVETVLPYNLDAWDGYPAEREAILGAVGSGKKLVSLAGDTHNAWHSDLRTSSGTVVGMEFACSSVSSPGFEAFLGSDPTTIGAFEQLNTALINDLHYLDASHRGFVEVSFTATNATSTWKYVGGLATESTATTVGRTVTVS